MHKLFYVVSIFLLMVIIGCSKEDTSNDPEKVLKLYFNAIYNEDYKEAVRYYGGGFEELQGYHPSFNPKDHVALFEAYIEITGGQRVNINEIVKKEIIKDNKEYVFHLSLIDKNGDLFREGVVSHYTVKEINGKYKVLQLPPYLS